MTRRELFKTLAAGLVFGPIVARKRTPKCVKPDVKLSLDTREFKSALEMAVIKVETLRNLHGEIVGHIIC